MKQRLGLTLLSYYFLPFCVFFLASLRWQGPTAFLAGLSSVCAATLFLYLILKKWSIDTQSFAFKEAERRFQMEAKQVEAKTETAPPVWPKASPSLHHLIVKRAENSYRATPHHLLGKVQKEHEERLRHELSSKTHELEMQLQASQQKDEEIEKLKTEVANLKFELYALFRIDEQILSNQLSTALLKEEMPDRAEK